MAPCSKLRRSCMVWGSVSASTVAPAAGAALPAASWPQAPSGFMAETPSTFQLTGRSASSDMVERKSMSSSVKPLRQPATMSSTVVPSCWRTAAARRSISSRAAARDGTGWPSPSLWVWTCEVEKPSAPSASAACSAASMAVHVTGVGRAPDGALAHDEAAQRRVPDEEAGVHGDAAVEPADPFAEGAPVPGQAGPQRGERHALDPRHHPRDVVDVLRRHGRQREAAVAAEHRGHAVQRRRAGVGVPEELRVVVGVQVDEARRDEHAVASITVSARTPSAPSPTATIRSPSMTTSARTGGAPVPSTTVPPRMATVMSTPPVRPGPAARRAPAGGRRPACPRSPARRRSPTASTRPSARTCRWRTGRGR